MTNGVASQSISDILSYANTAFGKDETTHNIGIGSISNLTLNYEESIGCGWNQTAAITSITVTLSTGNYVAGTEFMLLGQN